MILHDYVSAEPETNKPETLNHLIDRAFSPGYFVRLVSEADGLGWYGLGLWPARSTELQTPLVRLLCAQIHVGEVTAGTWVIPCRDAEIRVVIGYFYQHYDTSQ